MFAAVITWFAVTATPLSFSVPAVASAVIFTDASVSPASTSAKLNCAVVNVNAVSSAVVTVFALAVGASSTGVTFTVIVVSLVLNSVPSDTRNVNVPYGAPFASAAGTNVSNPDVMFAAVITWLRVTAVPFSFTVPAVASCVIFTEDSVSPASRSAKLKSDVANVYAASS